MTEKLPLIMSLLGSLTLAACGGGGGGDGGSPAAQAAAPATSASAPSAASTPVVAGEALPSLASPQAGSTAATGNGFEGIWTDTSSSSSRVTAMIDPANNVSYLGGVFSLVTSTFFGAATTAAPNWTLTSGFETVSNVRYPATSGTGTYTANQTLTGSYVANNNTVNLSLKYDPANALAVTQSSVSGTWTQSATTLNVDDAGSFTGNILGCPVVGTLTLTTPGSNKNLYTMTMSGTTSTCTLASGTTYAGNAAITFLPVTGSTTLYQRSIIYLIKATDNSVIAYGQLTKR